MKKIIVFSLVALMLLGLAGSVFANQLVKPQFKQRIVSLANVRIETYLGGSPVSLVDVVIVPGQFDVNSAGFAMAANLPTAIRGKTGPNGGFEKKLKKPGFYTAAARLPGQGFRGGSFCLYRSTENYTMRINL